MKRYFRAKNIIPIVISLAILLLTFKVVGGIDFSILKNIPIILILFASIVYIAIKIINTFRFSSLYHSGSFTKLLLSLLYCNFVLSIAPFRAGEISYLSYMKKIYDKAHSFNVKNLLIIRIFDFISIISIMLLSSFFILGYRNNISFFKPLVSISMFLITLIILSIIFKNSLANIMIKIISKIKFSNNFILRILKFFAEILEYIKDTSIKELLNVFILSLMYWSLRYTLGYVILYFLGIHLNIFNIFFITSIIMLINIIPIQTIAGFGIHEASWTYFLILFGINKELSLTLALVFHIIILIPVLIAGLVSRLIIYLKKI